MFVNGAETTVPPSNWSQPYFRMVAVVARGLLRLTMDVWHMIALLTWIGEVHCGAGFRPSHND